MKVTVTLYGTVSALLVHSGGGGEEERGEKREKGKEGRSEGEVPIHTP